MSLKHPRSQVPAPSSYSGSASSGSASASFGSASDDDGDNSNKQQQQQQQQQQKHSVKSQPTDPHPAVTNDSESDSDSTPEAPIRPRRRTGGANPSIKPVASKPTPEPKPKKAAVDSDTTAVAPKPTPEKGKAKLEVPLAKKEKRKKKLEVPEEENGILNDGPSGKKRVWSEEDEITVLEGMMKYQSKYGIYPSTPADIESFHDFIKKSLQFDYTNSQIYDKIRRLRQKYFSNSGRRRKGAGVSFSKDHDQKIYDLSNMIWAEEIEPTKGRKKSRIDSVTPRVTLAGSPAIMEGETNAEFLYPTTYEVVTQLEREHANNSMHGSFKRALNLINPLQGSEFEKEWVAQRAAEFQLWLRREELKQKLAGTLMEVLKNGSQ